MHAHVEKAQDTCYPTNRCTWHKTCAALKHRHSIKICPHVSCGCSLTLGTEVSGEGKTDYFELCNELNSKSNQWHLAEISCHKLLASAGLTGLTCMH